MSDSLMATLIDVTGNIDTMMYTYLLVFMLVFCAIYFTIRTRGVQFRLIKDMWLFGGFCGRDSGIGPAQRAKTTIWN